MQESNNPSHNALIAFVRLHAASLLVFNEDTYEQLAELCIEERFQEWFAETLMHRILSERASDNFNLEQVIISEYDALPPSVQRQPAPLQLLPFADEPPRRATAATAAIAAFRKFLFGDKTELPRHGRTEARCELYFFGHSGRQERMWTCKPSADGMQHQLVVFDEFEQVLRERDDTVRWDSRELLLTLASQVSSAWQHLDTHRFLKRETIVTEHDDALLKPAEVSSPLHIAILGNASAGKSFFLNSLLKNMGPLPVWVASDNLQESAINFGWRMADDTRGLPDYSAKAGPKDLAQYFYQLAIQAGNSLNPVSPVGQDELLLTLGRFVFALLMDLCSTDMPERQRPIAKKHAERMVAYFLRMHPTFSDKFQVDKASLMAEFIVDALLSNQK